MLRYSKQPNQPCKVRLRDPGLIRSTNVFPRAFILSGMATAAGLAVSLLTESVGEVVISGAQRQSDIETWKEEEEKEKSALQSIFHTSPPVL